MTIAQLEADIACNSVLRPRIAALLAELQQADDAPALFSRTVARLRAEPAPDAPAPGAQTYDAMIYALLLRVYEDVKGKGIEGQDPRMGDALQDALKTHLGQLDADIADKKAKIEEEKSEKSKKITSEDIHEGFESKVRSVLHKTVCAQKMWTVRSRQTGTASCARRRPIQGQVKGQRDHHRGPQPESRSRLRHPGLRLRGRWC
jgi:hypothetical protein